MKMMRQMSENDAVWSVDGKVLDGETLASLLSLTTAQMFERINACPIADRPVTSVLAPIDSHQEVWAAGVTYLRSREARMEESDTADVYDKVYDADRAEVFFKGNGWRVKGPGEEIRVRNDSTWDVPEPELAIVINAHGEIVGYTAGNDVSSRSIEGENPLYLPQAKVYDGSAALGDGIELCDVTSMSDLGITMSIERNGDEIFTAETSTSQMKRSPQELADWLFRELTFPNGAILMTGTCLVPEDPYTLTSGDKVSIQVGVVALANTVAMR